MNKKALVIVGVFVALTASAVGLSAVNKSEMDSMGTSPGTQMPSTIATDSAPNNSNNSGAYVDYYNGVIANTSGTKILFFHAPWCPQCRALEASIENEGVPAGVTIVKVDYDSNQGLRQTYGVTIQTTLVKVDDLGNLVKKYVAYNEPNLNSVKRNLL